MATVTKYPHGTISWMDGQSTDVATDKAFYNAVLGWEIIDIPIGEGQVYTMFKKNGGNVAGLGQMPQAMQQAGVPSNWMAYISVDDVDVITAKAKTLGATVTVEPMDVFDNGRMAVITDPTGGAVAFWQPKTHIGASRINEDGAMVWNEFNTWKAAEAQTFYEQLFGWTFKALDGLDSPYWVFYNNGRANGGLMQMTDDWGDLPPHWINYIHVADLPATIEKIKANAGKIIHGPIDASVGPVAVVAAPSGAVFGVIQSKEVDDWIE